MSNKHAIMEPHTAAFESLHIPLPQWEGDFGIDLRKYRSLYYSRSILVLLSYHWWYVEVPRKDTPVGVLISTRYIFKANLTFVPGYALEENTA